MATNKNKILFYRDWIDLFESLTDEEAGRLIKHFCRYVNDLNPTPPDRTTEIAFINIRATLKRDLKKWEGKAETNRENGKLGGRPVTKNNPNNPDGFSKTQPNPKKGVSVSVSVNDSVNVRIINTIVEYLNDVTGKKYQASTNKTVVLIKARLNEGRTLEDFKRVIKTKSKQWKGTENDKYLRPETLFGNKFEGYLNEQPVSDKPRQPHIAL